MRQRLAVLVGLALVAGSAPAAGQTWKFDWGVNGGGSYWTPFAEEATDAGTAAFKTSWLIGTQATAWFWPRVGLRLNFPYEDRGVEGRDTDLVAPADIDHINIWGPTLDLLFRLKQPSESFVKGEFLPYLAVGGGFRYVNPAGDGYEAFDLPNGEFWTGVPFTWQGSTADTMFLSELSMGLGLVALGADWRMSPRTALRFELGDRISKPYAYAVTPRNNQPTQFDAVNGHENDASLAHEIYGTVGLHLTLGGATEAPAAVVVAPPPPPTTPPPPPPATPPPPREESISVCVIDATSPSGVRTASATFLPASGDTMVTVNGQRVAFRTTVTDVPVAANADWLIAGRPLEVAVTPGPARFLPAGQTRTFGEGTLVLLGTVNGLHVFAERAALGDAAAQFGTAGELATVLRGAAHRRAFNEVQTLYVPYRTVGCAFQPLQRQEEVRKAR